MASAEKGAPAGEGGRRGEADEGVVEMKATAPRTAAPPEVTPEEWEDFLYGPADEAKPVTNLEFLHALCPVRPADESFWTTAFTADPNSKEAKWWGWHVQETHGPSEQIVHNTYFVISTIKTGDGEEPRRKKDNFGRMFVVPLDDPEGELPLAPSYVLQTSPKKRQAGYRLKEPITDAKVADRLIDEMVHTSRVEKVDTGGCNITRYVRLPVGCNGKASHVEANGGEPFQVKLVEWHPERTHTVEEVAGAFGLDLDYIEGRTQRASTKRRKQTAAAGANNILAALRAKGLYKATRGEGKHEIVCPWVDEHTTGDGGTAYFEPSQEWPLGGFKCLHGHCSERHLKDLCKALGVETPAEEDAEGRPLIFLRAGARLDIIAQIEKTFAENDLVFSMAGTLVKPTALKDCGAPAAGERVPGQKEGEDPQDPSQLALLTYNRTKMLNTMAGTLAFRSWDGEAWRPADPPEALALGIVEDPEVWKCSRPLAGITTLPLLRRDGTVWAKPGWDPVTKMMYRPREAPAPLPEACSKEEAAAALERFSHFLSEYPFKEPSHRAAILSMALAGLARHFFDVTPLLLIDAPKAGSGKTKLAKCVGALMLGVEPGTFTCPSDPQETRKIFTSGLKKGDVFFLLDNHPDDGFLDDDAMNTFVTAPVFEDRLLGSNETRGWINHAILTVTGNQTRVKGALQRRTLQVRIVPDVEQPELRSFAFDPVRWVLSRREEMVRDGMTVLAAYLRAGRPGEDKLGSWGSFEDFKLVRGALVWLGQADPRDALAQAPQGDADADEAKLYLRIWRHVREREARTFTVREIEPLLFDLESLKGANLGKWLSARRDQVKYGKLAITDTRRKATGKRTLWQMQGEPSADALEALDEDERELEGEEGE